jgi:hypothetical protein
LRNYFETRDGKRAGCRLAITFRREEQSKKEIKMRSTKSKLMAMLTAVSLVAPMAAMAQQGQRPPAPPLAEIATALGVSEAAVKTCFPGEGGKTEQGKSQAKPARPDAAKIATCLKPENSKITKAKVEKVLQDFAPKPQRS